MRIPVANIYYLLCYAWDKLEEKDKVAVSIDDKTELLDLFAKIIIKATRILLKRGIDRNYIELSSEVPGTSADWPSDITLSVNGADVGTWTSPGDFGDKRGVFTPDWWKLKGSQYGKLKNFRINDEGSFVDGVRISDVRLADLKLDEHHSIRLRIGVRDNAKHPGGINIFGRGFGNYDQDIILRLKTR